MVSHSFFSATATASVNHTRLRGAGARTELLYQVTDPLNHYLFWCSRSQMFFKIDVLKHFTDFTGKHRCWSHLATFLKRLQHRCFLVKFVKLFKKPFLYRTPPVTASIFYKIQFRLVLTSLKIFLERTLRLTFPSRFPFLLCKTARINYISMLGAVHVRWVGPARLAGSPRWTDFYPPFIWNLLSHFNQKVCLCRWKKIVLITQLLTGFKVLSIFYNKK